MKLGFVEDRVYKKKREVKAEEKEKDKFKDVKSRLYDFINQDKEKQSQKTTEEQELNKIQQKGGFKALPLKRSILERTHSYAPSERSRAPTEFKEFKLRTNNLLSSSKAQAKIQQLKEEAEQKFAYVPFKAREINKKMFDPVPLFSS
jgi:hypothetical protein